MPFRLRSEEIKPSHPTIFATQPWREYRTYFHIGSSWSISEASVCRIVHWVENRLMGSGRFRLPGKKQLVRGFDTPSVVVMDVTETPIERPKLRERRLSQTLSVVLVKFTEEPYKNKLRNFFFLPLIKSLS